MHCHIIPGVDDGAKTMEDAFDIIRDELAQGVTNVIMTPHFRMNMFETTRDVVETNFRRLVKKAGQEFPEMKFYLGCEFHANHDMTDMLRGDLRYRMCGSRYVLLEFSSAHDMGYIRNRTYTLVSSGFTPVIAHCERYGPIYRHIDFAEELTDMGAMLQLNADSVLGMDGFGMKMFCRKMLKKGLVSFVGSDAHNTTDRSTHIGECADYIEKKYGSHMARRIFVSNPQLLIGDELS
jgi:protein-tyrosine phosphatase